VAGRRLSHAGHARVLAALEKGDAVAARVAMAGHLREVHELIAAREAEARG
jgi:GntR family transcriptional repressor for pyruvate dehydrogenase complex